jgi:Na+/proline symporter
VQRKLTWRSPARGAWSVISGVLIGVPAVLTFLILGLLLHVFFQRPDLMGTTGDVGPVPPAPGSGEVFTSFALTHMSGWGGAGLVIAGLFAAGPAGINSSLNAMAGTLLNDFIRPLRARAALPPMQPRHELLLSRLLVVLWAVILGLFAMLCIHWQHASGQQLLSFALGVMSFAYAGLLGVFLTALFTRRGSTTSAACAVCVGFCVVLAFNAPFWLQLASLFPGLFPDVAAAPADQKLAAARISLPWIKASFPWQLLVGTACATIVCCAGTPRRR